MISDHEPDLQAIFIMHEICDAAIGQLSMCDLPKGHTGPHHDFLSGVTV